MYRNDAACEWIRQYRDDGWPIGIHFYLLQDHLCPDYKSRPDCIEELRDWLYNGHGKPIVFAPGEEPIDALSAHRKPHDRRSTDRAVIIDYSSCEFAEEAENQGIEVLDGGRSLQIWIERDAIKRNWPRKPGNKRGRPSRDVWPALVPAIDLKRANPEMSFSSVADIIAMEFYDQRDAAEFRAAKRAISEQLGEYFAIERAVNHWATQADMVARQDRDRADAGISEQARSEQLAADIASLVDGIAAAAQEAGPAGFRLVRRVAAKVEQLARSEPAAPSLNAENQSPNAALIAVESALSDLADQLKQE